MPDIALASEVAFSRHPVFGRAPRVTTPAVIEAVDNLMANRGSTDPAVFAQDLRTIVAALSRHPDGNRLGAWHLRERPLAWYMGTAIEVRRGEQPVHLRVLYGEDNRMTAIQESRPRKILGVPFGTRFEDCHRPDSGASAQPAMFRTSSL